MRTDDKRDVEYSYRYIVSNSNVAVLKARVTTIGSKRLKYSDTSANQGVYK